jgi:NAD(P)H-flavin reductase
MIPVLALEKKMNFTGNPVHGQLKGFSRHLSRTFFLELFRYKGDTVGIRGPFGKGFPIDNMFGYDVLIVGGGLGIVPLRSLIRYITYNKNERP